METSSGFANSSLNNLRRSFNIFIIFGAVLISLVSCRSANSTYQETEVLNPDQVPGAIGQPTYTVYPTYTIYPTYTTYPTYSPQPIIVVTATFSPTPEFTPTNTNTPTITNTPTKSPTPTKTPTNTPTPHLTWTAQAIINATKGANATATRSAFFTRATQNAQYEEIKVKELSTYPDKHTGEKVKVWGRIFNINSDTQFQMWMEWTYESVYVIMNFPFSNLYDDDRIIVYGTVKGEHCGNNAYGAEVCSPLIIGDYYERK